MDILKIIVNVLFIIALVSFTISSIMTSFTYYREIKLQRHKKEILENIEKDIQNIKCKE